MAYAIVQKRASAGSTQGVRISSTQMIINSEWLREHNPSGSNGIRFWRDIDKKTYGFSFSDKVDPNSYTLFVSKRGVGALRLGKAFTKRLSENGVPLYTDIRPVKDGKVGDHIIYKLPTKVSSDE